MTPTVAQLKSVSLAIQELNDPLVEWEPGGTFGSAADPGTPFVPDTSKIYVNLHEWRGEPTLCVKRYFREEPKKVEIGAETFVIPGEICRWQWALPPWGAGHDLPPLSVAVDMQRLPESAFPLPGEGVEYTENGVRFNGEAEIPLWRFLKSTGKLG